MTREKLEEFAHKIFLFFERMEFYDKRWLDFFNKEYEWVCKNMNDSSHWTMTLTDIINSDMDFVENNPKLFDKDFLKNYPHLWHLWQYDMTILHDDYIVIFYFSFL